MSSSVHESHPPGDLYCPTCERAYVEGAHCPADGTRLVRIKAAVDPLLGRNLDGRYTILEKLGQGGMGAVYRGTQHSVGREVAIKVISAHLVADRDAIKRFLREAKLASRLSHPNAVSVLEFGQTDDGLLYLVMELVSGRTLDQVIKREGVLKPERIVRVGTQVCDALEGAHALQIVHRDLKPANIMLLAQGRDLVKVLDFGLAKSVAPDQASTTMTNAGALLGTPAFMPPELALGGACDHRADLYSLGVILFLLGTGRLPFSSESPHELIAMHGTEPAPPMTGVPTELAAVVDRLLAKDPGQRFQSAADTREALEAALVGRMTPVPRSNQGVLGGDTNPSLGPFPATPQQFAHLSDTPMPPRRSAADLELASSDTIAAPLTSSSPSFVSQPRRRRWLVPAVVFGVVAVVGTATFLAVARKDDTPAVAPAEPAAATPPPASPAEPAANVELAPPTPAPPAPETPAPVEATSEEPATATVEATVESPAASKPAPKVEAKKTPKRVKPPKQTKPATSPTGFKPATSGINPTSPATKPPPKQTGSGAGALPF